MPAEFQERGKSNFTNPMYEATANLEAQAELAASNPEEVRRAMSYEPQPLSNIAGKSYTIVIGLSSFDWLDRRLQFFVW